MSRTIHVIGNGLQSQMFDHNAKGARVTCNLPPFPIRDVFATCMVDFKMMRAMADGSVHVPGDWVLGARPKAWLEHNVQYRMRWIILILIAVTWLYIFQLTDSKQTKFICMGLTLCLVKIFVVALTFI